MRNLHWKQFIIAGIALLVSCSGSGEQDIVLIEHMFPAFIPYIEEIQVPSTVKAHEVFEVTFRVSAELNPSVLLGRSITDIQAVSSSGNSSPPIHEDISICLLEGGSNGEPRYEYRAKMALTTPSETEVRFYSAPSRETGGMDARYYTGSGNSYIRTEVGSPSLTYQSVMVTVEPADE